jgi:hypothetical protein
VLWSVDSIFADLASHQGVTKGSKKVVQQSPSKSLVAFRNISLYMISKYFNASQYFLLKVVFFLTYYHVWFVLACQCFNFCIIGENLEVVMSHMFAKSFD